MSPKRTRRTADQRIADLQAEIERLKTRAARQKTKRDPALRDIAAAVRAIDKALKVTRDKATRTALDEARGTLNACLTLHDALPRGGRRSLLPRSRRTKPEPASVLAFIQEHPGSRSEDICAALATDAAGLRSVLHGLRDQGAIQVTGKARATSYSAKA
jgi:hypothetical protein